MENNVVELPQARSSNLRVLSEVQRVYEDRLAAIESSNAISCDKLQMQVKLLRSWVSDLKGQNSMLVRAVEDLESEATSKVVLERRKNTEEPSRKKPYCEKITELKIYNDSLQKENIAKDREIRRLNKDVQQYEQTILNLRSEINHCKHSSSPDVSKNDTETMTECFVNFEPSSENVRMLRKENVRFSKEVHMLRQICAALDQQCCTAKTRAQFKDEIIREMRRQLKQAKEQLKEETQVASRKLDSDYVSGDHNFSRATIASHPFSTRSHRAPTMRGHHTATDRLHPDSDSEARSLPLHGSGDDRMSFKSN